jgi:hypothetical protein
MSAGKQYEHRRIVNWPEYNRALVKRGSLTIWFDEDLKGMWFHKKVGKTGRGLDKTFSDKALQLCLALRAYFHLSLRGMQGFVDSVFELLGVPLRSPNYTVFSKGRGRQLQVAIPQRLPAGPVEMVVDSTGLKVFGEGEWKVRNHGASKRRTWRKLHLGVDPNDQEVIAVELTAAEVTDAEVLPDLLDQLGDHPVGKVEADGAYDQRVCYSSIASHGGQAIIPPRRNAVEWAPEHPRTDAVGHCRDPAGRKAWKQATGYHRRSLAETAMYRYKQLLSARLKARLFETQEVEVFSGIAVLNRLNRLGMPERA